ncbi:unnamed protein product, partial [Ixodes persulcatus]
APSASTAGASSELRARAPSAHSGGSLALGAVRPRGRTGRPGTAAVARPTFISKSDAHCLPPEWPETVAEPADVGPRPKAGLPDGRRKP